MFELLLLLIYQLNIVFSVSGSAFAALYQKNINILETKLTDISNPLSPNYGKWMSKEEIGDIVNPSLEEQLRVVKWLKNNNITDIKNFGDSIHISAAKDELKRIFRINNRHNLHLFNYSIPESLQNIIEFIEMDSKHVSKDSKKTVISKSADNRFFEESLLHLYNVSSWSSNDKVYGASLHEYQNAGGFRKRFNSTTKKQFSKN